MVTYFAFCFGWSANLKLLWTLFLSCVYRKGNHEICTSLVYALAMYRLEDLACCYHTLVVAAHIAWFRLVCHRLLTCRNSLLLSDRCSNLNVLYTFTVYLSFYFMFQIFCQKQKSLIYENAVRLMKTFNDIYVCWNTLSFLLFFVFRMWSFAVVSFIEAVTRAMTRILRYFSYLS